MNSGGDGTDQHRLRGAPLRELRHVARYFPTARRVADVDRVLQAERIDHPGRVGCISVHVVTLGSLRRATVASAIVRDHAIAAAEEEHHLGVPVVGAERPAVMEEKWLAGSPILVEDLGSIGGGD